MLPLFRSRSYRSTPKAAVSRPRRQRLAVEALEGRQLLSLGSEFLVNRATDLQQLQSDNASAANGLKVAAYVHIGPNANGDIRFQMFEANGALRGQERVIGATTGPNARHPKVAMDDSGDFVVAWSEGSGSEIDVKAQVFNNLGQSLSNVITVAGGPGTQTSPDVAMSSFGEFTVAYQTTIGTTRDIHARQYGSDGAFQREITVTDFTSGNETNPSVAMSPDGRFAVAYQFKSTSPTSTQKEDILLARYDAFGGLKSHTAIAFTTTSERNADVAMDGSGNAVVVYEKLVGSDFDIKAVRVSNTGAASSEINIRSTTSEEFVPKVAMRRTGGSFVVAYHITTPSGGPQDIGVDEINADNTNRAHFTATGLNREPALSIDASGNYLLTYSAGPVGGDTNIHGRRGLLS